MKLVGKEPKVQMSEGQEPEQTAGCTQQLVWTLACTTKAGIQTVWT